TIAGIPYLWPASSIINGTDIPRAVRFLAPFDPVVRDRVRFNHLWAWPYQFEAYVPAHKRTRGYYAMPLLWGEDLIGWGNLSVNNSKLMVNVGFVQNRPNDTQFNHELEKEMARMTSFLKLP
ncbi:MAG: winged helix DNA-binding domain-containing protein, partial [Candidatus Roizmanbacteria bacterium]|nr:winged helix DNA-binding domain-containing protein [Candidatus Roizmanbacteria bacterium]